MDIKRLRYFLTIAKEGQITRAAKKLHIAQPPLSQQLKILEQELGVTLIERNKREIELTAAGKTLYKRAEAILQQLDETIMEVKDVEEGISGVISLGSLQSCFAYLPERIKFFQENYPLISFQLREGDPSYIADLLRKREIDFGIVRFPLELQDFSSILLPKEPFVAVLSKKWDKKKLHESNFSIEEFKDIPLLLLHRVSGMGVYELIINECRRCGFEPNVVCECPDAATLLSLAASGIGASILPKSTILPFHLSELNVYEINNFSLVSEAAVIWLKDRYLSKSALRFIETFQ